MFYSKTIKDTFSILNFFTFIDFPQELFLVDYIQKALQKIYLRCFFFIKFFSSL